MDFFLNYSLFLVFFCLVSPHFDDTISSFCLIFQSLYWLGQILFGQFFNRWDYCFTFIQGLNESILSNRIQLYLLHYFFYYWKTFIPILSSCQHEYNKLIVQVSIRNFNLYRLQIILDHVIYFTKAVMILCSLSFDLFQNFILFDG